MLLSCDTGLMCHLLGFTSPVHNGPTAGMSFYRERQGHSVDLVLETDGKVFAVQMSPYSPGAAGLKTSRTSGRKQPAAVRVR